MCLLGEKFFVYIHSARGSRCSSGLLDIFQVLSIFSLLFLRAFWHALSLPAVFLLASSRRLYLYIYGQYYIDHFSLFAGIPEYRLSSSLPIASSICANLFHIVCLWSTEILVFHRGFSLSASPVSSSFSSSSSSSFSLSLSLSCDCKKKKNLPCISKCLPTFYRRKSQFLQFTQSLLGHSRPGLQQQSVLKCWLSDLGPAC